MIIALMIVIALLLLFDVIFTAATFARLDRFLRKLERQIEEQKSPTDRIFNV